MVRPERLKAERRRKGWTLKEAAANAGVALDTWAGAERGRKSPQRDSAERMAEALWIDVEDLERPATSIAPAPWLNDRLATNLDVAAPHAPNMTEDVARDVLEHPWRWCLVSADGEQHPTWDVGPEDDRWWHELMLLARQLSPDRREAALAMLRGLTDG